MGSQDRTGLAAATGRFGSCLIGLGVALCGTYMAQSDVDVVQRPATLTRAAARADRDRALDWLILAQREDGSWSTGVMDSVQETFFSVESFYAWKVAAHSLACIALARAQETPVRRRALEGGLEYLIQARLPQRGSDWDTDQGWGALYGFVACVEFARDARFQEEPWRSRVGALGKAYLALLARLQSPSGGWAYYDDPIYSRRPTWDTSFCTALVLPALRDAQQLGWLEDRAILDRAQRYVARCAMPGGAFAYDLASSLRGPSGESINHIKGSLGRTQVCNYGLHRVGEAKITLERIREGLAAFLTHHKFLEVARLRPVPHEAYYANAGYFFLFGHYYAAQAIELLPLEERESWHARLRPLVLGAQRQDGSAYDFNTASYGQVAGTAYLALTLTAGIAEPSNQL